MLRLCNIYNKNGYISKTQEYAVRAGGVKRQYYQISLITLQTKYHSRNTKIMLTIKEFCQV